MELQLLENIQITVNDRKRMKAAKSWRIFLALQPTAKTLSAVLSAMIESQVGMTLRTENFKGEPIEINLDPVVIEDVLTTRSTVERSFVLVLETVYEHQAKEIALPLTAMVGETGTLTLKKSQPGYSPAVAAPASQPDQRGSITEKTLRGLHYAFFQNEDFFDYIGERTGREIRTAKECKEAFKVMMNVSSCTKLDELQVRNVIDEFNRWIQSCDRRVG